ncbi:hypothetical protein BIU82_13890 [Arthrobacter sp. SW1]|uniref:ABC transporter ATP-binding protein/permease n=1 Tax=Arthrobacter sp. SW1 TaxID=1920889 RepID=UPI000877DA3F|nr:ATP-binding cassette domain-containing protein [Arthrobacter sp. SW1]OFI39418.1 hypothetical protein BIU82_13890 [Arthrobacter sp. SW1]
MTELLMREESAPLLRLDKVSRTFRETSALADVSLEIRSGEFVAIIGPSGSGKSTLLNILGLLDRPTSGSYEIHEQSVATLRDIQLTELRARTFGFVFQESHMVGRDTAARNAALGLRARGIGQETQKALLGPALERLGLSHRLSSPASNLSGGERQRLAITRAVIGEPAVILADEPTGSLDTKNGKIVLRHLRALHATGTTVIMVTHDPEIAASADRVITMQDGRITGDSGSGAISDVPAEDRGHRVALVRHWRHELTELAADALSALTTKPAKAFLLAIAFLLGSGGLVASIGLSESAAVRVSDRIDAASNDEVRGTREGGYASWGEVKADVSKAKTLPGVRGVGIIADLPAADARPSALRPGSLPGQATFTGSLRVSDSEYLHIQGAQTSSGDPKLLDSSFGGPVAFLGRAAAAELGVAKPGPGTVVWLYGSPVPVVGLITNPGRDLVLDDAVVVGTGSYPVRTRVAATFVVRTEQGMPASLADALPKAINPAKTGDIKIQTVADLRELKQGINKDLARLVAIVSSILLVIACLSAGTTMYLGVLARSSEIALRRALGMRRSSLAAMFLSEGSLVGTLGGVAGSAAGTAAVLIYSAAEGWAPSIPWYTAAWGIGVGLISGIASAVYPALAATKADPAQLIRT